MSEKEMSREDLVYACARYRMALEAIAAQGYGQMQTIAKLALEGEAPTIVVGQPEPLPSPEPLI